MSVEVKIEIRSDTASPRVKRLLQQLQPREVGTVVGPKLAEHWRDHLAGMPRNKHGYPSTGFWEEAARSVTSVATDDGAMLRCGKVGVRQRLHGGPIVGRKGMLTIPICAEAYGTTVADWGRDNLTLVVLADRRMFFAVVKGDAYTGAGLGRKPGRRVATTARRAHKFADLTAGGAPKVIVFKGSGGGSGTDVSRAERHLELKFLFKLQPETAPQEPNPDVVPSDMAEVALATLSKELKK